MYSTEYTAYYLGAIESWRAHRLGIRAWRLPSALRSPRFLSPCWHTSTLRHFSRLLPSDASPQATGPPL